MNSLFGEFVLSVVEYLVDKPDSHWNEKLYWKVSQVVELELKLRSYSERKPFWTSKWRGCFANRTVIKNLADRTVQKWQQTWESDNTVRCSPHWGGSLQNGLVERPWLQLMYYTIYLLYNCNFWWKKEVRMEVSTDWCVTVEYQGSSSIKVIFVNYQTSKLQCNY